MLIKDWEYNNFIKNVLSYKFILIHGQDRGKVNEKLFEIEKQLAILNQNSIEVINFNIEEFYKSENYFYELVYQKSFFSKLTLLRINLDLFKSEKDFFQALESLDINNANYIIIESKYLLKSSSILHLFKKNTAFALIACYQEMNVSKSILKYAKLYSLNLDAFGLNYLTDKFGNDTLITKSEIKKLALYSNGEKVDYSTILEAIGDNSLISLNEFIDSIGIEKKAKVCFLYEKTLNLGLNYIIFLRSLTRHIKILLEAKSNNIKSAKDIKPLIHFSRHTKINQQLQNISIKQLKKYLVNMYDLEIKCKTNYDIHELLIKKFVISLASY